jgi:predicted ATP-grasp superfamily ATP-dependent carboligase
VLGSQRISPLRLLPDCSYEHFTGPGHADALLARIERTCLEHAIELVVAADYPLGLLLAEHGERLLAARVAPLPAAALMRTLHDKWQFSGILSRLGLPQPRTLLCADAAALASVELAFPLVTKPVDRWSSLGFQTHRDRAQLERRMREGRLGAAYPVLAQEHVPGHDVGFAFLARRGQLVAHAAFDQPARGVRRHFDAPRLREHVALLLRETGYHGVGEIDARYDPDADAYRLLEVNPRFWASLLYAVRAGMNFAELLLRMPESNRAPGFVARSEPVRLTAYERGMSHGVLLAEGASNAVRDWVDQP